MQRPHLTVIARETDLYGASPNDSAGRGCKMSVGTCGKSCAHQTCVTTVLDLSCGAHPTVPRVRTIQLPERHVFLTLALGMVPFSGPKPLWMQSRVLVHLPSAHDSSLRERPGGAEFSRVLWPTLPDAVLLSPLPVSTPTLAHIPVSSIASHLPLGSLRSCCHEQQDSEPLYVLHWGWAIRHALPAPCCGALPASLLLGCSWLKAV